MKVVIDGVEYQPISEKKPLRIRLAIGKEDTRPIEMVKSGSGSGLREDGYEFGLFLYDKCAGSFVDGIIAALREKRFSGL